MVGSITLLIVVQHSARQLLQQSATTDISQTDSAPLVDLRSVEVRFCQSGHETMHLKAARLAVFRDLRNISVDDISDGVAYQGDKPALLFSAGEVQFQADYSSLSSGLLRLSHTVNAQFVSLPRSVDITTNALSWNWPAGTISADTSLTAVVGGLGVITCSNIQFDPATRSINFGGVTATADISVLPAELVGTRATPPSAAAATGNKTTAEQDTNVKVSAPEGGRWDQQQNILTVRGPVTFRQADATMQTIGAVYDRTTNTAKAQSPVKITDRQDTLTGTTGGVNFQTHIAKLDGDVNLHAISSGASKGSLESQDRDPAQLKCDHMTYNYRTRLADATGHLIILQTNRTVTADIGHYDANTQIATLTGDVDAKDTDGKDLRSNEAKVSVKKGDEWIEIPGPITVVIPVNDDGPSTRPASQPPQAPANPSSQAHP